MFDEYTSNSDFVLLMSIWNPVVILSEQIQDSNEREGWSLRVLTQED